MRDALDLHRELSKVCPIAGLSIGAKANRETWRVDYAPAATPEQISAAQSILSVFDFSAPSVPASVSMWQAKAALAASGKLDAANASVAQVGNPALSIAWEYATDLSRESPALAAIGAAIGLSPADIDALFIQASNIKV